MGFQVTIDSNVVVREVPHGTDAYREIVELRYNILRKPLNMQFTTEQLAKETEFTHLGLYASEKLVACLMLVPLEKNRMQMKQVAVGHQFQNQGYGRKLVTASEVFAKKHGFTNMYCHARHLAVPFYKQLGYKVLGDMFTEIGIPHFAMEKQLINAES